MVWVARSARHSPASCNETIRSKRAHILPNYERGSSDGAGRECASVRRALTGGHGRHVDGLAEVVDVLVERRPRACGLGRVHRVVGLKVPHSATHHSPRASARTTPVNRGPAAFAGFSWTAAWFVLRVDPIIPCCTCTERPDERPWPGFISIVGWVSKGNNGA